MRLLPRSLTVLLVAVAAVAWPGPPATAADASGTSWSVGPVPAADGTERANFDLRVDPGAVVSDTFRVRNDGATPLDLSVYAADAFTTREGSLDLPPAGTLSVDAGLWVRPETDLLHLEPGQDAVVPFTISIPADARPGDHPAGIVAALRTRGDGEVALDRRLGTRIHLRVSGELSPSLSMTVPTVSFTGTWNPFGVGDIELAYDVTNTGNTRATGIATPTASGPLGFGTQRGEATRLLEIMPGSTVEVRQSVPGVVALLHLDAAVTLEGESVGLGAGRLEPLTASAGLVAVPVVPLVAALAISTLTVALAVAARRRRRAHPTPASTRD